MPKNKTLKLRVRTAIRNFVKDLRSGKFKLKSRLVGILLFNIVFLSIPSVIDAYFNYFDNTQYYYLEPQYDIPTDKDTYRPGETVIIVPKRFSRQDLNIISVKQLIEIRQVRNEEVLINAYRNEPETANVEKSSAKAIGIAVKIPTVEQKKLEEGNYYATGSIEYEIRGTKRIYIWTSKQFKITA
jgi:hypothetical protein